MVVRSATPHPEQSHCQFAGHGYFRNRRIAALGETRISAVRQEVSIAISKDKEPSYSSGSRTIRCPQAGRVSRWCCNTFLCSFCARSNYRQLEIKDLARLSRLDLRVPRRELIYLVLTHLEEQFAGIARAVCQILNLQTRVRFPVALPITLCYYVLFQALTPKAQNHRSAW